MKHYSSILWAGMAATVLPLLQACSEEETMSAPNEETTTQMPVSRGSEVYITADDFTWETNDGADEGNASSIDAVTRSSLTVEEGTAKFSWTAGDFVGILPDEGAQVYFDIPEPEEGAEQTDEDRRKAVFDGGAWALKAENQYAAYYPFVKDFDLDRTKVPVDYTGQKQTGTTTGHLGAYDFMAARPVMTNAEGGVTFDFDHVGALVLLRFTVPTADTRLKSVTLSGEEVIFTVKGTYDLTAADAFTITPAEDGGTAETLTIEIDHTTANDNEEVTLYFMAAPATLADKSLLVTVTDADDNNLLHLTTTGEDMAGGGGYLLEAVEPEASYSISYGTATITVPEYASDASVQAAAQAALAEKSDITYLVVNGALTKAQQNALAEGLAGAEYLEEVTLTDVPLASITPAVAALYSTVACDDFKKVVSSDGYSIVQGGSVGDNATYTLYYGNSAASMTLNIDGTGAMNDFEYYTPWSDYNIYITTVNIANGITSIGEIAFYNCVITSVTIPESVTNINDLAFADCSQLMTVICKSANPPTLGLDILKNIEGFTIYVPAESVDTYKYKWSDYADIIQPIQ